MNTPSEKEISDKKFKQNNNSFIETDNDLSIDG
jgi:hypothetical protein